MSGQAHSPEERDRVDAVATAIRSAYEQFDLSMLPRLDDRLWPEMARAALDAWPARDKEGEIEAVALAIWNQRRHELDGEPPAASLIEAHSFTAEEYRDMARAGLAALDDYRSNPSRGGVGNVEGSASGREPLNEVVDRSDDYRDKEGRA